MNTDVIIRVLHRGEPLPLSQGVKICGEGSSAPLVVSATSGSWGTLSFPVASPAPREDSQWAYARWRKPHPGDPTVFERWVSSTPFKRVEELSTLHPFWVESPKGEWLIAVAGKILQVAPLPEEFSGALWSPVTEVIDSAGHRGLMTAAQIEALEERDVWTDWPRHPAWDKGVYFALHPCPFKDGRAPLWGFHGEADIALRHPAPGDWDAEVVAEVGREFTYGCARV